MESSRQALTAQEWSVDLIDEPSPEFAAPQEEGYVYTRQDGIVERALTEEEVIRRCPVFRDMDAEEASLLLALTAKGKHKKDAERKREDRAKDDRQHAAQTPTTKKEVKNTAKVVERNTPKEKFVEPVVEQQTLRTLHPITAKPELVGTKLPAENQQTAPKELTLDVVHPHTQIEPQTPVRSLAHEQEVLLSRQEDVPPEPTPPTPAKVARVQEVALPAPEIKPAPAVLARAPREKEVITLPKSQHELSVAKAETVAPAETLITQQPERENVPEILLSPVPERIEPEPVLLLTEREVPVVQEQTVKPELQSEAASAYPTYHNDEVFEDKPAALDVEAPGAFTAEPAVTADVINNTIDSVVIELDPPQPVEPAMLAELQTEASLPQLGVATIIDQELQISTAETTDLLGEQFEPETVETYRRLTLSETLEVIETVEITEEQTSFDVLFDQPDQSELAAEVPVTVQTTPDTQDFEALVAMYGTPEAPATLETITQSAEREEPLETILVQLAEYLSDTSNTAELVEEDALTTALEELQAILPNCYTNEDEPNAAPHIMLEAIEKILALLRAIGYQNPSDALVAFVTRRDSEFLLQAMEYICQLKSHEDKRQEFLFVPTLSFTDDTHDLRLRASKIILTLVAKFDLHPAPAAY